MTKITAFISDESGATIVDMTMLMAAMAGLALAVMVSVNTGMGVQTGVLESTLIAQNANAAW